MRVIFPQELNASFMMERRFLIQSCTSADTAQNVCQEDVSVRGRKHCTLLCDCLICENIEKIDRGKECSDSTEDLEPAEEDDPLTSESEPEDDASDNEEQALDLD